MSKNDKSKKTKKKIENKQIKKAQGSSKSEQINIAQTPTSTQTNADTLNNILKNPL